MRFGAGDGDLPLLLELLLLTLVVDIVTARRKGVANIPRERSCQYPKKDFFSKKDPVTKQSHTLKMFIILKFNKKVI